MITVALDGPAGAGKSTLSDEIAKRFSLIHVDTGAIYRAVGYYFTSKGEDYKDPAVVVPQLENIKVTMEFTASGQKMILGDNDITDKIRTPEASRAASAISAIPEVRAFLLEQQRILARENDVIMDGRDIGTVVLPDAQVKIFLTARPEARAERRHMELVAKGIEVSFEEVLKDVMERDYNDMNRAAAPLRPADDAIIVDTSELDFNQSIDALCTVITSMLKKGE